LRQYYFRTVESRNIRPKQCEITFSDDLSITQTKKDVRWISWRYSEPHVITSLSINNSLLSQFYWNSSLLQRSTRDIHWNCLVRNESQGKDNILYFQPSTLIISSKSKLNGIFNPEHHICINVNGKKVNWISRIALKYSIPIKSIGGTLIPSVAHQAYYDTLRVSSSQKLKVSLLSFGTFFIGASNSFKPNIHPQVVPKYSKFTTTNLTNLSTTLIYACLIHWNIHL